MSVICSTNCCPVAVVVPASYYNCTDVTREAGTKHFILIDCSYQFTDITDAAEWEAAIAAGSIQVSPPGILTAATPDQTIITDFDGCGREYVADVSYVFDFITRQTADDLSDVVYWKDLFQNSARFAMAMVDCNGIFTVADNYVDATGQPVAQVLGETPGLDFSITVVPHENPGEGRLTEWTTQFKIKKSTPLCKVLLPGVQSAICAA